MTHPKKLWTLLLMVTLLGLSSLLRAGQTDSVPAYDELQYTPSASVFNLWAPTASGVRINFYSYTNPEQKLGTVAMKKVKGLWTTNVFGNLAGQFYAFQIKQSGEWLGETPGIKAKAVSINGLRGAVLDLKFTDPKGWEADVRPPLKDFTDMVLYEMHLRDFSMQWNSGIYNKGKFLSLTEGDTKFDYLHSSGLDHLVELGITHVHLLPAFDFGCIDETHLTDNKYNWGYDPQNYNVPEGSYATSATDPSVRIRDFKLMVKALHQRGIRVIMDVVYNHTYRLKGSNFDLTAPGYFYRYNADGTPSNASGCNNETASEKPMMRQFMIESVLYWAKEYHIDGFRFDLMGIHDIQTMNEIRKALDKVDPTIFIYGEGWTAGSSPLPESQRAVKANGLLMPRIAVFSDDFRDAVKGHFSDHKAPGFVGGKAGLEESVKFGIVGAISHPQVDYAKVNYSKAPYANNPDEVINYVSCHDDLCLFDKLKISAPEGTSVEELIRRDKLAQTMVFTAQGVPFILSGEELLRTKQGVSNSFESPDSINQLDWSNKNTYVDVFNYYKALIQLRKDHPAFRMKLAQEVQANLQFLETSQPCVVGFLLKNHANGDGWKNVLVIHNGNSMSIEMDIPEGTWTAVVSDGKIDTNGLALFSGSKVTVPPVSSLVAFQ